MAQFELKNVSISLSGNEILKNVLDLPTNIEPVCMLPIGYPKEIKAHNTRLDLEDIVIYK